MLSLRAFIESPFSSVQRTTLGCAGRQSWTSAARLNHVVALLQTGTRCRSASLLQRGVGVSRQYLSQREGRQPRDSGVGCMAQRLDAWPTSRCEFFANVASDMRRVRFTISKWLRTRGDTRPRCEGIGIERAPTWARQMYRALCIPDDGDDGVSSDVSGGVVKVLVGSRNYIRRRSCVVMPLVWLTGSSGCRVRSLLPSRIRPQGYFSWKFAESF